ncbi:hypothetical protein PDE_06835 [Penicillium oxalicum 114-2]|uniref:Uncharacterized protein n=1 Tax=Penicillium oxalicum (strain 114-2 / CGMCC 5302) TaxID=933388 RepID=S8BAQ3_PENO1|nr:hypothetical protein PDE_06835 [Penicillium oxalicum 114-2]
MYMTCPAVPATAQVQRKKDSYATLRRKISLGCPKSEGEKIWRGPYVTAEMSITVGLSTMAREAPELKYRRKTPALLAETFDIHVVLIVQVVSVEYRTARPETNPNEVKAGDHRTDDPLTTHYAANTTVRLERVPLGERARWSN